MRQYNKNLKNSAKAFRQHVAPIIRAKWQVKFIHYCEGTEDGLDGKLDHQHGVDYLLFKGGRMHGLASRVLFRREYENKITVRRIRIDNDTHEETPSDFLKLKTAIENGGIYPEMFCVACVVGEELITCVAVRTEELIKFIDETKPPTRTNTDRDKNQTQEYFVVDWRDMKKNGYKVFVLKDAQKNKPSNDDGQN